MTKFTLVCTEAHCGEQSIETIIEADTEGAAWNKYISSEQLKRKHKKGTYEGSINCQIQSTQYESFLK